jgi:2-keto-4-pentenoate hydratase/2-oxohepta-3-ene-1,7-dioic acid hydratase in catechol pathway
MKFLRCGNKGKEIPAALDKNGKFRDLSSHISDFNPENLNFNNLEKLKKIDLEKLPEIPNSTRIGSCVSKPGKFVGIGLNFSDHAAETGAKIPTEPIVFMKATSCIAGPNDDLIIPKNSKKCDWEVEIAFVVGKEAKQISEIDAPNYIFGYCLVNDVSEREWQIEKLGQWVKGKSADTFGPIGPYLVTPDEIKDIQNLNMNLEVNGKNMQKGNTNKMIFNINYLLSYLSNFMSLQAGDIITTGTPPGVGMGKKPPVYLKSGDEIKLFIDMLGEQRHKVK